MIISRIPAIVAGFSSLCAFTVVPAFAQQTTPNFTRTLCVKLKTSDIIGYERLVTEIIDKVGPVGLRKGSFAGITLSRAVYPGGRDGMCDYLVSWNYKGFPPEVTPQASEALFQEAGVGSFSAFMQKLAAVSDVVRADLWATVARAGTVQKGDYFRLNRMKIKPGMAAAWRDLETKSWGPVMEARVADGELRGWFSYSHVLPAGSEQPYSAATVDVFPSWDKMWTQKPIAGYVAKAHPKMTSEAFNTKTNEAREMALIEAYQVITTHR